MIRPPSPPRAAGFTLVELVIVIIILAILGGLTVGILLNPFRAFQDQSNRAQLVAEADLALTRMVRELRMAVPNSVRLYGTSRIEFIPAVAGGRYRALPAPGAAAGVAEGEYLDFNPAGTRRTFQVLGPLLGEQAVAGKWLVVYNAASDDASDVSAYAGNATGNRKAINGFDAVNRLLTWSGTQPFPFPSFDAQRFDIIDGPVSYFCNNGQLLRSSYGFGGFASATPHVLAENVTSCTFAYQAGDHVRNGVASLRLTLTRNQESITLLYQAQVVNAP